jgi:CDP-diacylglycerol--glycerol-3-phosphate 3-phosphatidyltransferase
MDLRKTTASLLTKPLLPILSKTGLTPDFITWFGLIINIIAAWLITANNLLIAGLLVLFSGLLDILDGALARYTSKTTVFGSLLDSSFDRLSEAILLFGLLVVSLRNGNDLEALIIFGVLISSFLVSYVRARAEGLGLECKVGLFTRVERVIILALGLMINQVLIALIILLVFSFFTFGQRLFSMYRQVKKQNIGNQNDLN